MKTTAMSQTLDKKTKYMDLNVFSNINEPTLLVALKLKIHRRQKAENEGVDSVHFYTVQPFLANMGNKFFHLQVESEKNIRTCI